MISYTYSKVQLHLIIYFSLKENQSKETIIFTCIIILLCLYLANGHTQAGSEVKGKVRQYDVYTPSIHKLYNDKYPHIT